MERRAFVSALIGAAACFRVADAFSLPSKLPIIGFLGVDPGMWAPWTGAFLDRLNALGWIDGRTAKLEFRWAEGRPELYAQFARELVQLKADVIVTSGAAVPAVAQATSSIPIVFAVANDPVKAGMVKSLSRPGGNVTGISLQTLDLANKRFELLHDAFPAIRRVAVMADASFSQAVLEMHAIQDVAAKFGLQSVALEIRNTGDIAPAFDKMKAENADALYVVINELLNANRLLIVNSAQAAKLPSIYGTRDWVLSGGLLSYGPNFPSLFSRTAEITDKILHGTNPEDIPVEQPTRFELVVNLKTAQAIGVHVSDAFLTRADAVIE